MNSTRDCFGVQLRFHIGGEQRRAFLSQLFLDKGGVVGGIPLKVYRTSAPYSDRYSRLRSTTPPALRRVVDDFTSGLLGYVALSDRRCQISLPSDEVPFLLDVAEIPDRQHGLAQTVKITGPPELCDWEKIAAYCRRVVEAFPCVYGNMMAARDFVRVFSHLAFLPVSPFVPGQPEQVDPEADELLFYQRNEKELDKFVPKAYWGNVLSPSHIEGLGGEQRVRDESGCYLVERWGQNLYLQATPSIWEVPAAPLKRLNEFLAPIRFPGAPEPSLN